MTTRGRALSKYELFEHEGLGERVAGLTERRTAMRSDHLKLKVQAIGVTPTGHKVYGTLKSLGSQILSIEGRIDRILAGSGASK